MLNIPSAAIKKMFSMSALEVENSLIENKMTPQEIASLSDGHRKKPELLTARGYTIILSGGPVQEWMWLTEKIDSGEWHPRISDAIDHAWEHETEEIMGITSEQGANIAFVEANMSMSSAGLRERPCVF